ncbi:hypothetical protein GW846_04820 [Candidatus Gracilibacteria bacterium]|nr:hypothetical protein [Candidatus Gracilibacteria bacterium]
MAIETNETTDIISLTPAQELAELTGIPEAQITPEQIEKYELAKSIDANLDLVTLKAEIDITKKIIALNTLLEQSENQNPEVIDKTEGILAGLNFSELSLDELKVRVGEGIDGASEALEAKKLEAINAAESKFKSEMQDSFIGKLIPEKFLDWVIQTGKDKVEGKADAIQGWIVGLLIGFIPGAQFLMDKYEEIKSGDTGDIGETTNTSNDDIPAQSTSIPQQEEGNVLPEISTGDIEKNVSIELKDDTRLLGYNLMSQVSGLPITEKSSNILGKINERTNPVSLISMRGYLSSGANLKSTLGLEETTFTEEEILGVVIAITGPVNEEFFETQINAIDLQLMIGKNPDFNEDALLFFTKEELKEIESTNYNYLELRIGILARLSVFSLKNELLILQALPGEYAGKLKNFFGNILEDENISALFDGDEVYPKGVSLAFKDILTGDGTESLDSIIERGQNKLNAEGASLSQTDIEIITKIYNYKEIIISQIDEYGLGVNGFNDYISEKLSWGNIIALYGIMQSKDLSNATGFEKVFVYTWVYGILDGNIKGLYESAAAEKLLSSTTEEDSKVFQVLFMRILEVDRNIFLEGIDTAKGNIDGVVGSITGFNEIDDSWLRYIAINAVEGGGLALLIKLSTNVPVLRAVLIATSGIVATSIILIIKEKLYQDQQGKVGNYYMEFLNKVAPNLGISNGDELIAKIESGELTTGELYKKSFLDLPSDVIGNLFPES